MFFLNTYPLRRYLMRDSEYVDKRVNEYGIMKKTQEPDKSAFVELNA